MQYEFKNKAANPSFPQINDVTPQEVLEASHQLKLIDVREISEFSGELGHISQSELIVLSTLPAKLASIPKDKPIVFICRSGGRSAQAAAFAQSEGLTNVYNMKGGMLLWNQLNQPIE